MALIDPRNKVRRGVAPEIPLVEAGDIDIQRFHHGIQVVVAVLLAVEIVHDQLGGGVACTASHAVQACIDHQRADGVFQLFDKMDAERKRELLVVVCMKPETDAGIKARIQNAGDALEIVEEHGAEGVHDRDGNRQEFIHAGDQVEQVLIAVRQRICCLKHHLIALFPDLFPDLDALSVPAVREHNADGVNRAAVAGRKLIRIIPVPVDHGSVEDARILLLDVGFRICRNMKKRGTAFVRRVLQPADLYDIGAGVLQFADDAAYGRIAEFGIGDICTVPQGAVKQLDVIHISSGISHFSAAAADSGRKTGCCLQKKRLILF